MICDNETSGDKHDDVRRLQDAKNIVKWMYYNASVRDGPTSAGLRRLSEALM